MQKEILRSGIISTKRGKIPKRFIDLWRTWDSHLHPSAWVHPVLLVFPLILKSLVMKAAQFPCHLLSFTLLHCSVYPLLLTQQDKVRCLVSSSLAEGTATPSLQELLTLPRTNVSLQSYHLDLKKPPKLSPALCFLVAWVFFWIYDHSSSFPLAVLPWVTHFFELNCSKLHTAPAEASLMLNAVEGLFYMPCTVSSTLYDLSMVSCLTAYIDSW